MALINLKDVTVSRINNTGNGFSVLEQNESRGKVYKSYYTIWAETAHGLSVGDVISVSGFLSVKVGEPKTGTDGVERRYAEVSVNSPRLDGKGSGQGSAVGDSADVSGQWATDTSSNVPQSQTGAQPNTSSDTFTPDTSDFPF